MVDYGCYLYTRKEVMLYIFWIQYSVHQVINFVNDVAQIFYTFVRFSPNYVIVIKKWVLKCPNMIVGFDFSSYFCLFCFIVKFLVCTHLAFLYLFDGLVFLLLWIVFLFILIHFYMYETKFNYILFVYIVDMWYYIGFRCTK